MSSPKPCKNRTSGFVCSKVSPLIKDSKHIVSVLGRDYSSTWWRLLQYLMEITPVLGRDYCSTWAKYWAILFLFCSQILEIDNILGRLSTIRAGCIGCWRTGRGDPRPTMITLVLLRFVPALVGRWSPCHVLPTLGISNIMGEVINTGRLSTIRAGCIGAGGRGAETLVLLRFAPRPTMISNAIHSPLQRGGGSRVSGAGWGFNDK